MKPTPMRMAIIGLSSIFIIVPIILMFFHPEIGAGLFLIGLFLAGRVYRMVRYDEDDELNRKERQKNDRMRVNRSNIIMVQIVDDQGRDLPQHIIDQKMKEARFRAGPRDTVMPVKKILD